jgi:hypothetical protein
MEGVVSFRNRTTCYHCQQEADQVIKAVPNVAEVVCDNCGATRMYVPVDQDVRREGDYVKPGCYDIWTLTAPATCRHCHVEGPHDVTIGCRNFTIRCRNCNFTHLYRFNLEYLRDGQVPDK